MPGLWRQVKLLAGLILLSLSPVPACAQGSIQQAAAVTQFHVPYWYSNGVVADGGLPGSPFVSALGLFNGSACPLGVSSQTGPGAWTTAYAQLSLCQTAAAATISSAGINGSPTPPFTINLGGLTVWTVDPSAHMESGGMVPSCGTGCAAVAGTDSFFDVTGGSSVTSIAVSFAAAWPTGASAGAGPLCAVTAENAAAVSGGVVRISTSTTAVTLTLGSESGARYQVHCGE